MKITKELRNKWDKRGTNKLNKELDWTNKQIEEFNKLLKRFNRRRKELLKVIESKKDIK